MTRLVIQVSNVIDPLLNVAYATESDIKIPIASEITRSYVQKPEQVSELSIEDKGIDKYVLAIKINGSPIVCHVDLESQCSLIRVSEAKSLNLPIITRPDLLAIRDIGGNLTYLW